MQNMNTEAQPGSHPEPASDTTPDTTPEASDQFVPRFKERRQLDATHADIVYTFEKRQRTTEPDADTVEIPALGESDENTSDIQQLAGRHRERIGRHVTRGERKSRLESRMPVALGRLAYRLATRIDNFIQERRDGKLYESDDDSEDFDDSAMAPEAPTPLTFEQQVRAADAAREQAENDSAERKQRRMQRLRNTVGTVAAGAALIASTSSIMRSSDSADAMQGATAKATDKTLVIGGSATSANEGIARRYRELDEKASRNSAPDVQSDAAEASLWSEALKIDQGEGLFSTFEQMDIPQSKWDRLMDKVGPKLEDIGEAYYDKASGEYRLPAKGLTTRQALHLIEDAARKIK
jgi:hypothetical protein